MESIPVWFYAAAAATFGLVVGSFANVVIYRLPLEQSIVFPASRCPRCGASIKPWQNVPVLSWLLLRGRCAGCAEPISIRYPIVEALHGTVFALLVLRFGVTLFTPILLSFACALIVLAFIDWDHQLLPDAITLPWILIGLAGAMVPGALISIQESALTAAFGYLSFWAVAKSYSAFRGIEGLGQGDWKLAAMMGAFIGGQGLLLTVFVASLTGMVYGLIQAFRLRADDAVTEGSLAVVDPEPRVLSDGSQLAALTEVMSQATPAIFSTSASLEASANVDSGVRPETTSIGLFKLPFGTFLAGSAIFVLFCGEAILFWYRAQLQG